MICRLSSVEFTISQVVGLGRFNGVRPDWSSGRGLYANVDQSPLSGRGHVTPLDQSGRTPLNRPNPTTIAHHFREYMHERRKISN